MTKKCNNQLNLLVLLNRLVEIRFLLLCTNHIMDEVLDTLVLIQRNYINVWASTL